MAAPSSCLRGQHQDALGAVRPAGLHGAAVAGQDAGRPRRIVSALVGVFSRTDQTPAVSSSIERAPVEMLAKACGNTLATALRVGGVVDEVT